MRSRATRRTSRTAAPSRGRDRVRRVTARANRAERSGGARHSRAAWDRAVDPWRGARSRRRSWPRRASRSGAPELYAHVAATLSPIHVTLLATPGSGCVSIACARGRSGSRLTGRGRTPITSDSEKTEHRPTRGSVESCESLLGAHAGGPATVFRPALRTNVVGQHRRHGGLQAHPAEVYRSVLPLSVSVRVARTTTVPPRHTDGAHCSISGTLFLHTNLLRGTHCT
jgi:hypothetical protein